MYYIAPEAFEGRSELKSDVWSLGVMLLEMVEGRHPFAALSVEEAKQRILNGEPPSLASSNGSSECIDFVNQCLKRNVTERASVSDLLQVSVVSVE